MASEKSHRNILEVSLSKLGNNLKKLQDLASPLEVMAVLKANAYGLGSYEIGSALANAGVTRFGVAELYEALDLLPLGIPVHILGDILEEEIAPAVNAGIILPVTSLKKAELINKEALKKGKKAEVQFLVDTGMGRLGILPENAFETIMKSTKLPGLRCTGIYSHFPHAYGNKSFTLQQIELFVSLLDRLKNEGIDFRDVHIANSDGLHNIPASYSNPFNMIRTGINLYGCFDLEGDKTIDLEEVMTLKSRLVSIRTLPAGSTIGYGQTSTLDKDTLIGTVAIGYADGLPLGLSNKGRLLVRGKNAPVIGRVSMDYTTIILDDIPEAEEGDEVICLGEGIPVSEWASFKNTITYEIICALNKRVKRVYR